MKNYRWLILSVMMVACRPVAAPPPSLITPIPVTPAQNESEPQTEIPTPQTSVENTPDFIGYTYHRADGNRLVEGQGALPDLEPLDIALDGMPAWVVAAPIERGSLWVMVTTEGQVYGIRFVDGGVQAITVTPDKLPPGMPPLLTIENGNPVIITPPSRDPSTLTHPVVLPGSGQIAFIENSGDLVFWGDGVEAARLAVDALPDARILIDEDGRLLLLTGPTTLYDHGILADEIEASSITLIETQPEPRIVRVIPVPEDQVIEGIAPIWADLSDDGQREIIVTLSNNDQGAQLAVYEESGELLAVGPAIGQGHRWRNQAAVAPFGPDGRLELVDVLTPHIGGTVEFFQLSQSVLQLSAEITGYTSHVINTRNPDMILAGDFDGDGRVGILIPNQPRTDLNFIQHTTEGAKVAWSIPIGGTLTTNIAAVTLADNRLAVGIGRDDGVLRIWMP